MNKAVEFYSELRAKPRCSCCAQDFKNLNVLSRHFKSRHEVPLSDWLFAVAPNYCMNCGKQITGRVQDAYKVNFCSLHCKSSGKFNSRYGAVLSVETREKIGAPKRGRKLSEGHRLKIKAWLAENGAPFKGMTHTQSSKKIMSKKSKTRIAKKGHPFKGKKHSEQSKLRMSEGRRAQLAGSWKGNFSRFCAIVRAHLYATWTRPVLERDSFACQECGLKSNLSAHHKRRFRDLVLEVFCQHPDLDIKNADDRWKLNDLCFSYPPLLDLSNGITLCYRCHRRRHRKKKVLSELHCNQ